MKTKISILITMLVLMFGCRQDTHEVTIIKSFEDEFLSNKETDNSAIFTDDYFNKPLYEDIIKIAEDLRKSNPDFPDKLELHYRIFIDETGIVVALKNIINPTQFNQMTIDQDEKIIEQYTEKFCELVANWKIEPAKKNGKNVKVWAELGFGIVVNTENKLEIIRPSFFHINSDNMNINISDFMMEVEEMPEPIGGIRAIAEKVHYPEIAKRAGIEGRVFVKALIDENGNVVGTQVIKGIGAGCDEAAMEAVKQAKFKPGRQRGKAVKVQVTIPILFKLQ